MIYVIQTKPNKEYILKRYLINSGISAYTPEEVIQIRRHGKWHSESRYIFSGYVFIDSDYTPELFQKIKKLDGFLHFLGSPAPLNESETEQILWLCNDGKPIEASHYITGKNGIIFVDGILSKSVFRIIKIFPRQKRVKVTIYVNGKEFKVFLPIEKSEM